MAWPAGIGLMGLSTPPGRVLVLVKGWPRLSETFIAQEVLALQRLGLDQVIVSLRHPTDHERHALHRQVTAPVQYLPEYLHQEPLRVLRAVAAARRLPGWSAALKAWLTDLPRDLTCNRIRRFGQACVVAAELPAGVGWLHAHFLHTPASVARYAALLTGLPWSFSAHAKDIWTGQPWDQRAKLAEAEWGVTCSEQGRNHLAALAPEPDRVELVYHGLDFARFPAPPPARPRRDGRDATDPVVLLSVGRAVEKKGFDVLLEALARLPAQYQWRWIHIGGGPLLAALKGQAARLGLDRRISWLGARPQDQVIAQYLAADLFVLPARQAQDGDRDGLPNVLMEAQLMALPCIASRIAAIPELIDSDATGVLVPPDDVGALAAALVNLVGDPEQRDRLGRAGRARVRSAFGCAAGIDRLWRRFCDGLAGHRRGRPSAPSGALAQAQGSEPWTSPSMLR